MRRKKYNMDDLWILLKKCDLVDEHYRFKGWEHLNPFTDKSNKITISIIEELLLLINGDIHYSERGSTQELRIPEDICSNIFQSLNKYNYGHY